VTDFILIFIAVSFVFLVGWFIPSPWPRIRRWRVKYMQEVNLLKGVFRDEL